MEEINRMKTMLVGIFETNERVIQLLHEWDANDEADEKRCHRIRDLEDTFQRLEKRIQDGDNEFKELDCMIRNLSSEVEQAASKVMTCKRFLSRKPHKKWTRDRGTKSQRSVGLHLNDEGSENSPRQQKNKSKTICVISEQCDQHTRQPIPNPGRINRKKVKSKQKVRFADENESGQDVNIVGFRGSSRSTKGGSFDRSNGEESYCCSSEENYRETLYPNVRVTVSDNGFKRKLTKPGVDNRLRFLSKGETKHREEKRATQRKRDEKSVFDGNKDDVHDRLAAFMRDDIMMRYLKHDMMKQMKGISGQSTLDTGLVSVGIEETMKLVKENTDLLQMFVEQEGHVSLDSLLKDSLEMTCVDGIVNRAEIEKQKGENEKLPRGIGPDTVLCLDTSDSMKGTAFQEMISLAISFVDGIKHVSEVLRIEENIGVATFGKKSGVSIHLTNQYHKVKDVLLSLKPEGPSPILEGIHMAMAACEGNGKGVSISGIPVGSRIILISDGKGTPDQWNLSGDTVSLDNARARILVHSNVFAAGQVVKSRGNTVYSVPVGDYTKLSLEQIADASGGWMIQSQNLSRMIQFAQLQCKAANLAYDCRSLQEEDREPFLRAIIGVESTTLGEPTFDQDKMDILTLSLKYCKSSTRPLGHLGHMGDVMEECNSYMPSIGTRVRRGPSWNWGNQDRGGPGTVVGHDSRYNKSDCHPWSIEDATARVAAIFPLLIVTCHRIVIYFLFLHQTVLAKVYTAGVVDEVEDAYSPGTSGLNSSRTLSDMIWVEWDNGGHRNVYHYVHGTHDVTVVDEERQLAPYQDIAVGCKVKRGKDWMFEDQDGGEGTVGVVCRVISTAKVVYVRWPNKVVGNYRFGGGLFDVQLVDRQEYSSSSESILPPKRSVRSNDNPHQSVEDMNRLNLRR